MKPLLKNILIFGGIFILLVVGYVIFFGGKSATPALVTTGGTTGASTVATSAASQNAVGAEFLTTLLNLQNIKLNDAIFSDPTFRSLQDFELTLIPETNPGRPNPFSPLGIDTSAGINTGATGTAGTIQTGTATTPSTSSGQAGATTTGSTATGATASGTTTGAAGGPTAPGTGGTAQ